MALPFPAVKITHGEAVPRRSLSDHGPAECKKGDWIFRLSQCNAIQKSFENLLDFQCKDFVATCMTATRYFCRSWNQQQKALNVLRHPDCLLPFQDTFLITWSSYRHANIISIDISIFIPWIFLCYKKPFQYFLCLEIFLMDSNSKVGR